MVYIIAFSSLLPCPLKIGVTLAVFHLEGKIAVAIQWSISLRKEFDIEIAAILNGLALIPSSPVALCGGKILGSQQLLY